MVGDIDPVKTTRALIKPVIDNAEKDNSTTANAYPTTTKLDLDK